MAVAQRHFPHDITTLIIDILGEGLLDPDDTDCCPALANCLLVSRSFCHHSRRHLFRAVALQNSPVDSFFERVAQLREIMAPRSNPLLGMISYIRVFSVEVLSDPSKTVYRKNGPGLATILEAFLHFESHLEDFGFWGCDIQWKRLGQTVHNLIQSIVRSPSLSTIHLSGLDGMPVSVLTGASCKNLHLRRLTMGNCVDDGASTLNLEIIPQLQLEAFATDNTFPLEYLSSNGPRAELPNVSTSPFSHLRKLVLEFNSTQECREAPIVLLKVMGSLQEMDVVLRTARLPHPKFIFPTINIGRFPKLQMLRLEQQYWSSSTFSPENSPSVVSILHPTMPCMSLERLDLHFNTHCIVNSMSPLHEAPIWCNIDALLSPSQFPSLKRVGLLFSMDLYMPVHLGPSARAEFLADAVPRLREAFPLLSISNSIEFTVEIRGIGGISTIR
ncbi:hypothetical protein GALMADRAFT_242057 [Galerina marginata CBS 339.88]|uniref:F-box domain-containing protein n=1 Tax=Galerina marginata (strain CBS 339.88) TaxID=685588 RepID=A0A067TC81_GALM3|nr:hypothetical protein GALMADRAFT_242057 [Galerina marginata CBS 339.88]